MKFSIAIVGGGFSGTLVLANLVAEADFPLTIEWFEAKDRLARGIAYSTHDPAHLLNVPAARLGAFKGKPEGFLLWLKTSSGKAACEKFWPGNMPDESSFVPRAVYGIYVQDILQEALKIAPKKNIAVNIHKEEVLTATPLKTAQKEFIADALILATGNQPPRRFAFQEKLQGDERFVPDIWQTTKEALFPHRVSQLPAQSNIVIIGTGLTAVDAILTLNARGYKGHITAISRGGFFPLSHAKTDSYPAWEWTIDPGSAPTTVYSMAGRLREEIKMADINGYDWRAVIDSLRPVTQVLWQRLPLAEKKKFMRRFFTLWNIHRHRMAIAVGEQIATLKKNGTLKILSAKILDVTADKNALEITLKKRGADKAETLKAALVLNCTGPDYDIAKSDNALLKTMTQQGALTPHALRVGLDASHLPANIFAIGPLLVGELLECTAVPELRDQAFETALRCLEYVRKAR